MTADWLDQVKWNEDGLVTAVAQEASTGVVLMLAWMNREALALSFSEGYAVYWSRSRGRLWRKGEESGHRQKIVEIRLDCDGDAILLRVEQAGGIACHTGRHHCFYQRLGAAGWEPVEPVLKSPKDIYAT
ncbi:MAG: phosphoribosyl-AMP cyclohydrolase [Methylotetracoccus sp.]